MSYISRKEELYKNQIIPQTMEDDFVAFWQGEVEAMRNVPLVVKRKELDLPYKTFKAYEIAFNAHDGVEVTAYFCVPNTYRGEKLPCVSVYHGGGGAYGVLPDFVATGVCTFCMDCRSQGGKTIDHSDYDYMDDYHGGLMSHGLLDKRGFYMKNIYLDAVRAVDVIATLPEVDAERIVAHGQSQGGALTIVAAALSGKIKKAYPSVPSYACLDRRVENASGVFKTVNVYLSAHPLDEYAVILDKVCSVKMDELKDLTPLQNQDLTMGGIVVSVREMYTKKGNPCGRYTLEDYSGSYTFSLYDEAYIKYAPLLKQNVYVFITRDHMIHQENHTQKL